METIYEIIRIKQVIKEDLLDAQIIKNPDDAADIANQYIGDDDREVFFVMCLNTKNRVVAVHRAHVGSLNSSIVHPREIFKSAILNNAASIVTAHQHPSQDLSPSQEDLHVNRRLMEVGKMLGIELLDNLIINASGKYKSMKESGNL